MKLILMLPLAVLSIQAAPISYTVSDCGMFDSQAYQDCQDRMAASEAAYLATHVPDGIPWDSAYLTALPPLTQIHHRYFVMAASEDNRWIIVGNHDEDTDSFPAFTWHDGAFASADNVSHANPTAPGEGGWIGINDQGTIAATHSAFGAWLSPIGYLNYESSASFGAFNDANQFLFRDVQTWVNYLYAPAPLVGIPGGDAPEPASFLLAGIGLAALISARRRKSSPTRCTEPRPRA